MEVLAYVGIGIVAYFIIGNIVACCMKLAGHSDIRNEEDFKIVVALWPAPILISIGEMLVYLIGNPSSKIYKWTTKWKS